MRWHAPSAGKVAALAYLMVGLYAFGGTLDIYFLSDDFNLLALVSEAHGPSVVFTPLGERFFRPLFVLAHYLNFSAFGLDPRPYHLTIVGIHILNSWLVFALAARLSDHGDRLTPFLTGLVFLVFAGHTEAVSWFAGLSDPLVTLWILTALLLFARWMDRDAGMPAALLSLAAFVAALQSKESAVIFPAIAIAYAAFGGRGTGGFILGARARLGKTIWYLAASIVLVFGFLVLRSMLLDDPFNITDLGTSTGQRLAVARTFVVRSFLPAGLLPWRPWPSLHWLDLAGYVIVIVLAARFLRGRAALVVAFSAVAMAASLLPVLPLSISPYSTESERYVYLPSVFSSVLLVVFLFSILPRRWASAVASGWCILHLSYLGASNATWRSAGRLSEEILHTFIEQVRREGPSSRADVFILNLPDNLRGAYVFRRGFHEALRLIDPELAATRSVRGVATHSLGAANDLAEVHRPTPSTFSLQIFGNTFLQSPAPSTIHYMIRDWDPHAYSVVFADTISRGLVLYLSEGQIRTAGTLQLAGRPFGVIDIPADGAVCTGTDIRFSGWALDDGVVARVTVEVSPLDELRPAVETQAVGRFEASRAVGTRPDVVAVFPGYPEVDRAAWNYRLSCSDTMLMRAGRVRVRVLAEDAEGLVSELGTRTILRSGAQP